MLDKKNSDSTAESSALAAKAHEAEAVSFSQEQVNHILKLLKFNSGLLGAPNTSVAHSGSDLNALACHSFSYSTPWIIDSGASDHMTSYSQLFHTYNPCSSHDKIRIADGSYSPITG